MTTALPVRVRGGMEIAPRLDVNILGAGLAVLMGVAWCTGAVYLVVRGGGSTPVELAVVDTVHIYVGIASVVFLGAKVWRVGLRRRVRGVAGVTVFDRQLSIGLAVLYSAVYVTGVLPLLPFSTSLRDTLVEAHLIAAVWAAVPTTWHVWRHRTRLVAVVRPRRARAAVRRLLAGALLLAPAAALLGTARSASPLAQTGAGAGWHDDGPTIFVDRLRQATDRTLVAGGVGLYLRRPSATEWTRVGPFDSANVVLGLTLPRRGPVAVLVGAMNGLYAAPALRGPYRRLTLASGEIHAAAVDPRDSDHIWCSSKDGFWESHDGGRTWAQRSEGVLAPRTAWALAWFGGSVYASDVDAVYRWTGQRWAVSTRQGDVDRLDPQPSGRLFSSSMGQGIRILDAAGWHDADGGLVVHSGGEVQGIHAVSTTENGARIYAGSMIDGAQVSTDGGTSWSPVWWRLAGEGVVWRIVPSGDQLVAATDRGVIASERVPVRRPDARWWGVLVGLALAAGGAGVTVGAAHRGAGRGGRGVAPERPR